ncbi:MAG: DUF1194 domain-containing protein [Rhodospirillales bacterium]|jgi:hypothetical protein|nr:DUF1194 domain-containing protein [Rhodospirillales bacterium]
MDNAGRRTDRGMVQRNGSAGRIMAPTMHRRPLIASALGALLGVVLVMQTADARTETAVDLELVLAVDVSGSMDQGEHERQRRGYVGALQHPDVVHAIRLGPLRRIVVAYVEWAGAASQVVAVPWRLIEDATSARAVANELAATPIALIRGTSISGAIDFAAGFFEGNDFAGTRRIIDISGDGPNNRGLPVVPVRNAALERGIIINGLPIMVRPSLSGAIPGMALDRYYVECVIGGPGAFVLPVEAASQLATAIRRKLVLEIAGVSPPRIVNAATDVAQASFDCLIGERRRRLWDP